MRSGTNGAGTLLIGLGPEAAPAKSARQPHAMDAQVALLARSGEALAEGVTDRAARAQGAELTNKDFFWDL
jgi:hypothetical protein